MKLLELIIDDSLDAGVNAISLVSDPAIELDWVALKKEQEVKLSVVDESRHILMGAALVPNKPILRKDKDGNPFNVFFSEKTIRQASELFFKRGLQSKSTLEHEIELQGNTVVESWIKEDEVHDKSVKFGVQAPVGSWIISMKIEDDDVYNMAKEGIIKGYSIEGYFADKAIMQSKVTAEEIYHEIMNL